MTSIKLEMSVKPIFFALDGKKLSEFDFYLRKLQNKIYGVKVGLEMFIHEGPSVVKTLKNQGWVVFLDLKLHDIPNTVKEATISADNVGADYLTVHIASKKEALTSASEIKGRNVKLLGVSKALTSHSIDEGTSHEVKKDFLLAKNCGLDGVICPPSEIVETKKIFDLVITPGIRLLNDNLDDQKNVTTPEKAIKMGAKYLVMGRSVKNNLEYITEELDI